MLRKLWHDPVWSKVISGIILGGLGLAGAYIFSGAFAAWLKAQGQWLAQPITIPVWLFITFVGIVAIVVLRALGRLRAGVGQPFEKLSVEQKALLENQFLIRRSRRFRVPAEVTQQRWFEFLGKWNYIEDVEERVLIGNDFPFDVIEAGWAELEKKLPGR